MRVLGVEVLDKAVRVHRDLVNRDSGVAYACQGRKLERLNELRRTWRNTVCVKGQTIFNVKGNKYRLLATLTTAVRPLS